MDLTHAREILDTAHNAVVSMDVTGRITYFNPAAEVMFGHASEAVIGQSLADQIIPEHYREAHWRGLQHFLETGEGAVLGRRVELSGLRSNGTEFPIEITISAQRDGESWVFHAFIQDISERVARERERGQRLAELETSLQDPSSASRRFSARLPRRSRSATARTG